MTLAFLESKLISTPRSEAPWSRCDSWHGCELGYGENNLRDGDALFDHHRHTPEELGKQPGTLALIFGKAQNTFDSHRAQAGRGNRPPV